VARILIHLALWALAASSSSKLACNKVV
jgi:hypothetical protein